MTTINRQLFFWRTISFALLLLAVLITGCKEPVDTSPRSSSPNRRLVREEEQIAPLYPLHRMLPSTTAASRKPSGNQTFAKFRTKEARRATGNRRKLYVVLIGEFSDEERAIIRETKTYLRLFTGLQIATLPRIPKEKLTLCKPRRTVLEEYQYAADKILLELLRPNLPDDAAGIMAITSSDLYISFKNSRFVCGLTSTDLRVGVVSTCQTVRRQELSSAKEKLKRMIKVTAHETTHIFGIKHECEMRGLMNGSTRVREIDKKPLWLSPNGLAKLMNATGLDPVGRYRALAEFAERVGFKKETEFFWKSHAVLRDPKR